MKVLVLGLPRTGTQSLAVALSQLGISPVYHMREVGKNGHAYLWCEAIDAKFDDTESSWTRPDFDRILNGFEGVGDYPAAIFPEELVAAYPEALIILTTRSEVSWCASMMSTLIHAQERRAPDDPSPMAVLSRKYHRACWGDDFAANGRRLFQQHNEAVRRLGKNRRFIEWEAKEGWAPICEFLGVPIPESPFPRSDDWVEYKKQVAAENSK